MNQIKEYAKERQNLTGIDHDNETIAIASQLTAMGLQGDALKSAINRTQDLSVAMNVDLILGLRLVGKAMQDGGEELKRFGRS